jgi:diguanylate cyclase (GGDEF)-like protein
MGQSATKPKAPFSSARAFVTISIIAFVVGLLVMLALSHFSTPANQVTVIFSSALLLAVIMPLTVYALVIGPMVVAYEEGKPSTERVEPSIQAALTDPVTQLPNRRGITSNLLEFMAQAERYNTPLSIALVQIADFKKCSDDLAPRGGEKLLQSMAEVFYDTLRMPDKAGRYDNEEFLVVLPHTKLKDASMIADRVRGAVDARELGQGDRKVKVNVAIGAIQFRKGEDLEQLLSRAEQAKKTKPAARRAAPKKPAK